MKRALLLFGDMFRTALLRAFIFMEPKQGFARIYGYGYPELH